MLKKLFVTFVHRDHRPCRLVAGRICRRPNIFDQTNTYEAICVRPQLAGFDDPRQMQTIRIMINDAIAHGVFAGMVVLDVTLAVTLRAFRWARCLHVPEQNRELDRCGW